jgi:hypothetical protein
MLLNKENSKTSAQVSASDTSIVNEYCAVGLPKQFATESYRTTVKDG